MESQRRVRPPDQAFALLNRAQSLWVRSSWMAEAAPARLCGIAESCNSSKSLLDFKASVDPTFSFFIHHQQLIY
jgi:hypothetical protein